MTHSSVRASAVAPTLLLLACAMPAGAIDTVVPSQQASMNVQTIAEGLDYPWAIAFLPDGAALVTERTGQLRLLGADGAMSGPISGTPSVDARGQGGLLDVAIDPNFGDNRLVYLSFAEPGPNGTNSTAVVRGRLRDDASALEGTSVIFSQQPKLPSTKHFGSRLVFDDDGYLFVTLGERSDSDFRGQAQDLDSHLGKIVRILPDGAVPSDNPFASTVGALPEIWSLGHRNIQAAALHPSTGQLWEIEHGPRGGDELNIVEPGANYGWPLISFGVNYSGSPVGSGLSEMDGMVGPIHQWTPVIAPSGMLIYSGNAFPEWQGDLFVGGLRSTALVRLEMDGERVISEERIIDDLGHRIRDVAQGPDGALYLVTDSSDGQVIRIAPVQ